MFILSISLRNRGHVICGHAPACAATARITFCRSARRMRGRSVSNVDVLRWVSIDLVALIVEAQVSASGDAGSG